MKKIYEENDVNFEEMMLDLFISLYEYDEDKKSNFPTIQDVIDIVEDVLTTMDIHLRERKLLIGVSNDMIKEEFGIELPEMIIDHIIMLNFQEGVN